MTKQNKTKQNNLPATGDKVLFPTPSTIPPDICGALQLGATGPQEDDFYRLACWEM
jgi:hypothetical protein